MPANLRQLSNVFNQIINVLMSLSKEHGTDEKENIRAVGMETDEVMLRK